jgi:histidyl-tRNA synthetase
MAVAGTPTNELLKIVTDLRAAGIACEAFLGDAKAGLRDQMAIANARQIPIAIILGDDELKAGNVSVKDLRVGMESRAGIQNREEYRKAGKAGQLTVPRGSFVTTVKQML